MKEENFYYAIGFRWYEEVEDSPVGFYAYGTQIFCGNIEDAEYMRNFISEREDGSHIYRIYRLKELNNGS